MSISDDMAHVTDLVSTMRSLTLEEMAEVATLFKSLSCLYVPIFIYDLPPPFFMECSVLAILRLPREDRVIIGKFAAELLAATDGQAEEIAAKYQAVCLDWKVSYQNGLAVPE